MGTSNGKIFKPVDASDVMRCLGEDSLDVGVLCRSGKINKWSKHKPVRRSTPGVLTEEDFMGNYTGEVYGLRMPSDLESLIDVLEMDYEYIRPTGRPDSLFRLRDFDGYDHYARPVVIGELIDASFVDVDDTITISIDVDYLMNNTTGVDLASTLLHRPATPEEAVAALGNLYPCIIIKNLSNGRVYTKAMQYRRTGEYGKLFSNMNAWEVDYICSLKDVEGLQPYGNSSEYKVAVYLTEEIDRTAQGFDYNLREWTEFGTDIGMVLIDKVVPVPGLTAMTLTLRKHLSGYVGVFLTDEHIYVRSQNTPVTFELRAEPVPDRLLTGSLSVGSATKTALFDNGLITQVSFTLQELGLAYIPMDEPVTIEASISIPRNDTEYNVTTKTYYLHFV